MKASPELLAPTIFEPGWYDDIPAHIYHRWDLCSASRLKIIADRSPAHLRAHIEREEEEPTPSMVLGTAIHSAVLEPTLFEARYVNWDGPARNTKAGKELWELFLERCRENQTILTADQYKKSLSASKAVWTNLDARILLETAGRIEVSGIWKDELGILCKCRIDKLSEELHTIVDVKTTLDASPREFSKQIFKYGYHRQGAMYFDACAALGVECHWFVIVAVETNPPFASVVYRLTDGAIEAGREELKRLKQTYKQCQQSGEWPGYPDGVVELDLPTWAYKQIEE